MVTFSNTCDDAPGSGAGCTLNQLVPQLRSPEPSYDPGYSRATATCTGETRRENHFTADCSGPAEHCMPHKHGHGHICFARSATGALGGSLIRVCCALSARCHRSGCPVHNYPQRRIQWRLSHL